MEVEEAAGGESPTHLIEPHVELDEGPEDQTMEPAVELDENVVEPQVEYGEGMQNNELDNVYPFNTLDVQFYEASAAADSTSTNYEGNDSDFNETALNGDNEADISVQDDSYCDNVDTSVDAGEMSLDTSNSILDDDNTNYNEMQRTYLKDFFSSSAFPSSDGGSDSNASVERIPLSRFPSIVKVVERAEYETIQTLYQLLYQRSAWDTQEILQQRILEFSGFTFNKSSEEWYNRLMLLQTLPNSILVKIGAILCLDQVKNVLSNVGLGRHDLINAILEFLALPRKKTRSRASAASGNQRKIASQLVEPCGCRNNCLSRFKKDEREAIADFHTSLKRKVQREMYFMSLIGVNKASKRPEDDAKKHRDYKYTYKIKLGKKEVNVCKGGFMMLHNVKMSTLNQLQLKLKKGVPLSKTALEKVEYPYIEGQDESEESVPADIAGVGDDSSVSATNSVDDSESSSSKLEDITSTKDDAKKVDDETKKSISKKVPAVVLDRIDPNNIKIKSPVKASTSSSVTKESSPEKTTPKKKDDGTKYKLKDFPPVVKGLDEASETVLIDLHCLLFSTSADSGEKAKENILEFDGFSFEKETEEYDEKNEFLQRMSGKLITDVAKAFSLDVRSKREEAIQNILEFLMKPDDTFLRTSASVAVILSDVEFDDIDGFSDSDESITCEVVEKNYECIDLLSSGEDSDKEDGKKKEKVIKKEKAQPPPKKTPPADAAWLPPPPTPKASPVVQKTPAPVSVPAPVSTSASTPASSSSASGSSGAIRRLKDFETIRKIVNTHPPEYLVDIYELLFLKKHEPMTLRDEILGFTGFTFEKGSPDYVKRKQVLDRMLYNNVRRVYNTLIHNSTEVKVFSKPTMINEIFQFLFKLPDHDTSVRPLPPGAKTLMPKTSATVPLSKLKPTPVASAPPTTAPTSILPSQSGKLSDLKRVFQRVACFPCEYLVDVHKLLFMSDCDAKAIRQNIFGFKGFSFAADTPEFQQRKMYLEYLTFHSLRKISSVLTTRSVDLRNSTKHELASHLTDVLAEYCNTCIDTESITPTVSTPKEAKAVTPAVTPPATVENIVVTPVIEGIQSVAASSTTSTPKASPASKTANAKVVKLPSTPSGALNISIVETRSISSPAGSTSSPSRGGRKRKSQTVRQLTSAKKASPAPVPVAASQTGEFADIHLPEVEQYRQIYGATMNNMYPNVPTITGIASFSSTVPQTFPQLVPQAMTFPIVTPYPQTLQVSGMQTPHVIGLQSTPITMTTPIITQVTSNPSEVIVPADIEPQPAVGTPGDKSDVPPKESPSKDKDSEEDGDTPLASLIGHPTDAVLTKQISDIVEKTDLQDITMNGVIQRIHDLYPKFDLGYRKEFIKSSLRTILYKLGENDSKDGTRDTNSPDCSVTTTDSSVPEPEQTSA